MNYLLRHSIDDNTRKGGWSRAKLTKEGVALAKEIAKKLKALDIERIVCSDLVRAKETAKIVNKELNLPITYTNELREFNAGIVSGMKYDKANKLYPVKVNDYKNLDFKYPKGETLGEFKNRVEDYYKNTIKNYDKTLFITHRNTISVIYNYINKTEWNFNDKKSIDISHCSLFKVSIKGISKVKLK